MKLVTSCSPPSAAPVCTSDTIPTLVDEAPYGAQNGNYVAVQQKTVLVEDEASEAQSLTKTEKTLYAAQVFILRRDRKANPEGWFDRAGRWYPSDDESCLCCCALRDPTRRWPYSLMLHCRTAKHVARLIGVGVKDLQCATKAMDAALAAYKKGEVSNEV